MANLRSRIRSGISFLLATVLVIPLLAAPGAAATASPGEPELVGTALASLRDDYTLLITGSTSRSLVPRMDRFGVGRGSAERAADTLRRRAADAAYGLHFISADVQLLDIVTTATPQGIALRATEDVRLSFWSDHYAHDPARDVTLERIPHTFTFALRSGAWVLEADVEQRFPASSVPIPGAMLPPPSGVRQTGGKAGASSPLAAGYYDWAAAADYLRRYVYNYNTAYRRFDNQVPGGDCTNFVSQALRAGGWQDAPGFYQDPHYWWYNFLNQTWSWVNVGYLMQFMQTSGRVQFLAYLNDLWIGDVLQIDFGANGTMDHSMMVDDKISSDLTGIFMTYHTTDTYHKALADIVASLPLGSNNYYAERIIGTY